MRRRTETEAARSERQRARWYTRVPLHLNWTHKQGEPGGITGPANNREKVIQVKGRWLCCTELFGNAALYVQLAPAGDWIRLEEGMPIDCPFEVLTVRIGAPSDAIALTHAQLYVDAEIVLANRPLFTMPPKSYGARRMPWAEKYTVAVSATLSNLLGISGAGADRTRVPTFGQRGGFIFIKNIDAAASVRVEFSEYGDSFDSPPPTPWGWQLDPGDVLPLPLDQALLRTDSVTAAPGSPLFPSDITLEVIGGGTCDVNVMISTSSFDGGSSANVDAIVAPPLS